MCEYVYRYAEKHAYIGVRHAVIAIAPGDRVLRERAQKEKRGRRERRNRKKQK